MLTKVTTHLEHLYRHINRSGVSGAAEYFSKLYYRKLKSREGTNIYSRDWDVLLVLDACRANTLADVAPEYSFLNTNDKIWSVGSSSAEWMRKTFINDFYEEMAKTTYITGNPFTAKNVDDNRFKNLEELWRFAWDEEIGTMPPRPLTDRGIEIMRSNQPSRLIIHYMQPHFPCIPEPIRSGYKPIEAIYGTSDIWDDVKKNKVDPETVYDRYVENTHFILENIGLLLSNIEANKVVITSDHGNAFGEKWLWGHPGGVQISAIREVPWYITSASDKQTYSPGKISQIESELSVEERLKALGYR